LRNPTKKSSIMKVPSLVSPWGRGLRWTMWGLWYAAWTAALLTPQPVEVADAVFTPEGAFSAGKLLHIAAYAGLTILTAWLPVSGRVRWLLLVSVSAHTLATEYLQNFVPARYASWMDVGIDHVGIALGFALSWRWWFPAATLKADANRQAKASHTDWV
jgi:VanZ family protein